MSLRGWCKRSTISFALVALISGCGSSDGLPRQAISGKVTMDGRPLPQGWIEFRPQAANGVTTSASPIQEGRYSVPSSEGLVPGSYRVAISAADTSDPGVTPKPLESTKKQAMPLSPLRFAKQLIPDRYNTRTTLVDEVKEGDSKSHDFALQSK